MNLPFFIARRYFFSRKKKSFISTLANLSMLGVGVGTMALVVVLSVFNGMEDLNRELFKSYEADLIAQPRQGKRLNVAPAQLARLRAVPGVALLTPVVQDNALARYGESQAVVRLKGVDSTYQQRPALLRGMLEGRMTFQRSGVPAAVVADGVRSALGLNPADPLTPLELWYPQNQGKTLRLTSTEAFNRQPVAVAGVFFVESRYDNVVLAPRETVRELLGYGPDQLTSVEVQLRPGANEAATQRAMQAVLGNVARVQTRDELNPGLYRAIRIEKLFVTLTLSLIILVASVNIFFSLSMLVIEKKADIGVLRAMGATPQLIRNIFLAEGAIIALLGAVTGLVLGVALCWVQGEYGLVGLGGTSLVIDAYPVRLDLADVLLTSAIVAATTFLTAWLPAQRATRTARLG